MRVKFVDGFFYKEQTLKLLQDLFGKVEESDNPDFLFCSVGYSAERFNYNCARIFLTGENIVPDFNCVDYAIGFNYFSFGDRYKRIPLYCFYTDDYAIALKKHLNYDGNAGDRKFCNFVYSNGTNSMPERDQFFYKLSKYKAVDSGGRHLNNVGGPVEDKRAFQSNYKFSIAFENAVTNGYTTEKILQAFSAGTIPIYYGSPSVSEEFNSKAFINCHDYEDFNKVIAKIEEIDCDNVAFDKMMREPIFSNMEDRTDPLKEYKEYLYYICSQDPVKAIRRCNDGWSKTIQEQMRTFYQLQQIYQQDNLKSKLLRLLLK